MRARDRAGSADTSASTSLRGEEGRRQPKKSNPGGSSSPVRWEGAVPCTHRAREQDPTGIPAQDPRAESQPPPPPPTPAAEAPTHAGHSPCWRGGKDDPSESRAPVQPPRASVQIPIQTARGRHRFSIRPLPGLTKLILQAYWSP